MAMATGVDTVGVGTAADMVIAVMEVRASGLGLADVTLATAGDAGTAMAMIVAMDGAASTKSIRRPAET